MIPKRGLTRRPEAQRAVGTSGSPIRRAAAVFGLCTLLGGLALPLTSLVLASEPAPFCCSKGRCCCADDAAAGDDRTCLRRGCGCDHRNEAVNGEPLRIEAVLSPPAPVAAASAVEVRWASPDERPIARAHRPPVPPPRRSLLA